MIKKTFPLLVSTIFLSLITSCITMQVPEEYVPDKEVVYLKQNTALIPIRYTPELTHPYTWDYDNDMEISEKHPVFLNNADFNTYLKPDVESDIRLYKEIRAHLTFMEESQNYHTLKKRLDTYTFKQPDLPELVKGDIVEKYSNGAKYEYPPVEGATITFLNSGSISIDYASGGKFVLQTNGDYYKTIIGDIEEYAVFLNAQSYRVREGDTTYTYYPDYIGLESPTGTVFKFKTPIPQYQYIIKEKKYIFFIKQESRNKEAQVQLEYKSLHYTYLKESKQVIIVKNEREAILLTDDYKKQHTNFDIKKRKPEGFKSIYLPEGIRIVDIDKSLTYSTIQPAWPEDYLLKSIGSFNILYTKKDADLIKKLSSDQLRKVMDFTQKTSGLSMKKNRTLVLPPDLESYRKLHTGTEPETLNWYPSGFQTKDIIICWPPSVKRYESEAGEVYFWKEEFYDILIHELSHLAIGESTGVFSPVPVWLNEGLAVYTESIWSKEVKHYWEITFYVADKRRKLLNWDSVTENSTGVYEVAKARIHYAQSYRMVDYLITTYGKSKLISYIKLFRLSDGEYEKAMENLVQNYKSNFQTVYGISWEDNIKNFTTYNKENPYIEVVE